MGILVATAPSSSRTGTEAIGKDDPPEMTVGHALVNVTVERALYAPYSLLSKVGNETNWSIVNCGQNFNQTINVEVSFSMPPGTCNVSFGLLNYTLTSGLLGSGEDTNLPIPQTIENMVSLVVTDGGNYTVTMQL